MLVKRAIYERLLDDLGAMRETVADERSRHELQIESAAQELATVREALGKERGQREVLSQQTAVQKSMIDFLCSRVNQLETERVILMRHLGNIDLPTPTLRQEHPDPPIDPRAALASLSIFEDDERHAPRGWHPDGSVNYGDIPSNGQNP